jgi:hypothetical protein
LRSGRQRRAALAAAALAALGPLARPAAPQASTPSKQRAPDPSDALFAKGGIPRLRLEIAQEEMDRLRAEPRAYVRARMRENDRTDYEEVAVKLKGAAGSFRDIDDKPAFTLNLDRFRRGQEFHGLEKLHLNNSVQDDTWLNELLASELMAAGGVPAPRVTHARVWLNGRDLGLYVLKEGFDKRFLARHFEDPDGNLYDGGFCQDVDSPLEKDSGKGPDDGSDLTALVEACRDPEPASRFARLADRVDVEAFVTFMAMELCTGHWDGYSLNRNNYRLYFDPNSKKAHFLPHGMDQLFQDPDAPVLEYPNALVAEAVMRNPEWRLRFRRRLVELLPLFSARALAARVDALADRLRPVLKAMGGAAARDHQARAKELEERLQAREKSLREQVRRPEPKTLEFDPRGVARVTGWQPALEAGDGRLDQTTHANRRALWIESASGGVLAASWRRRVMLARGRYSFEARVALKEVAPLPDQPGSGARLRAGGLAESIGLAGSAAWQPLALDFEVKEETRLVELWAELRAASGEAWYELSSLRLVKLPE